MALFETDEEKRIRERAEARQKQYEDQTGEQVPEEPGIEPDEITTGVVDAASGGVSAGLRGIGRAAVRSGESYAVRKLKEKGMPGKGGAAEPIRRGDAVVSSGYASRKPDITSAPGVLNYSYGKKAPQGLFED